MKRVLDSDTDAAQTNKEQDKEGESAQQLENKKKKKTEDGKSVPTNEWFEEARKLGRDERHKRLDFAILLLVCAAGLPT